MNIAEEWAARGRFDEAKRTLDDLKVRSPGIPELASMMAATARRIDRYRTAYATVDRALVARLHKFTKPQTQLWAREQARNAEDAFIAKAYTIRMGQLDVLGAGVEREVAAPSGKDEAHVADVADGSEADLFGPTVEHFVAEIKATVRAGDYRRAVEQIRDMLPMAGASANRLRDLKWAIEDEGKQKIATIVKEAEGLERAGQIRAARKLLVSRLDAFPDAGPLAGVHEALRGLERRIKAPAPRVAIGVEGDIEHEVAVARKAAGLPEAGTDTGFNRRVRRELAKTAREAFDKRDYAAAAENYRKAAKLSAGLHFERQYEALAAQADLMILAMRGMSQAIARDAASFRGVDIGYGEKATLLAADTNGIRARIGNEEELVPWSGIPDQALAPLLARAAKTGDEFVAAAVLYARSFQEDRAQDLLRQALIADAKVKPQVDALLALIRKENPGKGGYSLVNGEFVSASALKRKELSAKLGKVFAALFAKKTDKERDAVYAKVAETDAAVRSLVIEAFQAHKEKIAEHAMKSGSAKALERLRAQRVELDKRRRHAFDLIFDTVKYFYPYRPPAVSGAKAKEYARVQLEVDRRVAAVRAVWMEQKKNAFSLPKRLQSEIATYAWLTKKLRFLGANPRDLDARFPLAWAKPESNIRNFAFDGRERKRLDAQEATLAANAKLYPKLLAEGAINQAEIELSQLTNAYRIQMGSPALRCDDRLVRAIHGHCKEMSELGYFSHTSPTPGRRSPGDRMRRAGYNRGGGENLAINGSPGGAIYAWRHSSGHHRNMLSRAHRDIGTGNTGRYWGQNFGSGGAR